MVQNLEVRSSSECFKIFIYSSLCSWNFPLVILEISVNDCLPIILFGFRKSSQNKGLTSDNSSNSTNITTTTRTRATSRMTVVLTCKTPLENHAVTSTGGKKNKVYNKRQTSSKEILPTGQQTFIFRQQFSALLTTSYFSSRSLQHCRAHYIRYPALYNRNVSYMHTFLQNPQRK